MVEWTTSATKSPFKGTSILGGESGTADWKERVDANALSEDLYRDRPSAMRSIRAAEGRLFCGRNVCGGGWADVGIGIGEDARGRRWAGWGDPETGDEEAGVRVRDARSGNSSDFFLLRRERWTLWEAEEGFGLPPREGERALRAGESRRGGADCGLEDVLPMLAAAAQAI